MKKRPVNHGIKILAILAHGVLDSVGKQRLFHEAGGLCGGDTVCFLGAWDSES
jgi:hypothetical protein